MSFLKSEITKEQILWEITDLLADSSLTKENIIEGQVSVAKRSLMQKWGKGDSLTTLDLQRVLRIVKEEISGRK